MANLYLSTTNCNSLRKNWEILDGLKAKEPHEQNNLFAQISLLCRQYSLLEYHPQSLPPLHDAPRQIGEIITPLKKRYHLQGQGVIKQEEKDIDIDFDRWQKIFTRVELAINRSKECADEDSYHEELSALQEALCFLLDVQGKLSEMKAKTNC